MLFSTAVDKLYFSKKYEKMRHFSNVSKLWLHFRNLTHCWNHHSSIWVHSLLFYTHMCLRSYKSVFMRFKFFFLNFIADFEISCTIFFECSIWCTFHNAKHNFLKRVNGICWIFSRYVFEQKQNNKTKQIKKKKKKQTKMSIAKTNATKCESKKKYMI